MLELVRSITSQPPINNKFVHRSFCAFILFDADSCVPDANYTNNEHENHVDSVYDPNPIGSQLNHLD